MPRQHKRSFIWAAFTKTDSNNVKCNTCSSVYKLFGTTNLITHLKRKHPVLYLELSGEGNNVPTRTVTSSLSIPISRPCTSNSSNRSTDAVSNRTTNLDHESGPGQIPLLESTEEPLEKRPRQMRIVPPARMSQKSIDDALVQMIALDYQPLQIVENVGFKNYTKKLNPDYSLPSRKTLTHKLVHDKYTSCSNALKEMFMQVENLAVTTDMWTSDSGQAYLAVTVHFVHESRLESYTLSTIEMPKEHNSENISDALKSVLNEWGIFDKIVACVTDNANTMKKAITDIQKRNIYCIAHTLNLAVKDCLSPNLTPEARNEAKVIDELLSKCRSLVGHFKHSSKSSYKLQETQKQMGLPQLKLKQDVATRWNATLFMLERLVKCKIPLSATLPQIPSGPANLDSSQWDILEDCVSLLGPFDKMTTILSGELYPTLSSAIPLVRGLQTVLGKKYPKTVPGQYLKEMLVNVVAKRLNVYESYKTAAKSTFLDPRFKKKGFGLDSNADNAQQWVVEELSVIMRIESQKGQASALAAPPERSRPTTGYTEVRSEEDDLWECLDKKVAEVSSSQTPVSSAIVAVSQYLEMPYIERKENPLDFWEERKHLLPGLASMAFKYLCIPATSVPSERLFSKAGLLTNDRRNRLDGKKLDELLFLNGWFNANKKI